MLSPTLWLETLALRLFEGTIANVLVPINDTDTEQNTNVTLQFNVIIPVFVVIASCRLKVDCVVGTLIR